MAHNSEFNNGVGPSTTSHGGIGFSGSSSLSFASRARERRAAIEARSKIAPPPGFSAQPTLLTTKLRPREPSPSFYGVHDGRGRRHGNTKPLLPITPSITPGDTVITPPSPSPIPRTPSPPPPMPISQLPVYRPPGSTENSARSAHSASRSFSVPSASGSIAAQSGSNSNQSDKRKRNVIRKKSSSAHHHAAKEAAIRTGSTSSADATSATTSTSTSYADRDINQQPSIFGIPAPSTSYTSSYGTQNPPSSSSYYSRSYGNTKQSGHSRLPSAQTNMSRSRSGSGSHSQTGSPPGTNRLSIPSITSHLAKSVPRLSTQNLPPPISVPTAHAENTSTSSPSTAYCGSPGMFSYTSTPTSSSTNPSSIQSPGLLSSNLRTRNTSPTRPTVARNHSSSGKEIESHRTEKDNRRNERPSVLQKPSTNTRVSTTSTSSTSTIRPDTSRDRRSISLGSSSQIATAKGSALGTKHTRTPSKDSNSSKPPSASSSTFGGFHHFRKSSKDISTLPTPSSASHSRKSSHDSSVQSPSSASAQSSSYFPGTAPIPIPNTVGKIAPIRPSRDGQPDITTDGVFTQENIVIQSGIITLKDPRSKTPRMITSSSLPQRRNGPISTALGTTPPAGSLSTSTPGQSKGIRSPTSQPAKATKVVRGFAPGTTNAGSSTSRSVETSPRKKKDEKKIDSSNATSPPPKPSFLSSRSRTKTVPAPSEKPNVLRRPGPVAGTGHEGYSFVKTRTRSASGSALPTPSSSKPAVKSSNSASSTPSGSLSKATGAKLLSGKPTQMDDFLRDRLKPAVLKGNGDNQKSSDATKPQSNAAPKQSTTSSERQKNSLEIPRNGLAPGSKSLDLPRQSHETARPELERSFSGTPGKSEVVEDDYWPDGQESSWLRGPTKHLGPPDLTPARYSPKLWNFQKSKSAPEVAREPTTVRTVAPTTPTLKQTSPPMPSVKFGDENYGGFIKDVHSPPTTEARKRRDSKGYTANMRQKQHVHSLLLPEPSLMTSSQKASGSKQKSPAHPASHIPAQVVSAKEQKARQAITQAVTKSALNSRLESAAQNQLLAGASKGLQIVLPDEKDASKLRTIRPPPGLPVPAALQPAIELTPRATSDHSRMAFPTPAPARSLEDIAREEVQKAMAMDKARAKEEDLEDEEEEEEDEEANDSEILDSSDEHADTSSPFSSSSDTRPSTSGPTPSPRTTPRPRLEAIGRIPTPKSQKTEVTSLKLPTLADILPPPPTNPNARQQPIKIHPPKRIAHPQYEPETQKLNKYEHNDFEDDEQERQDLFSSLPPLIITEDMANKQRKRLSESTDDWNEYDDYIEEMTGTPKSTVTRSNTSSLGAPFPYTNVLAARYNPEIERERKGKERAVSVSDSPTLPSQPMFSTFPNFPLSNKKKLVLNKSKLAVARPLASIPSISPPVPDSADKLMPIPDVESARSSSSYGANSATTKKAIPFAEFVAAYTADSNARVMSTIDPLYDKGLPSPHLNVGLLSPMSYNTDFEDESNSEDESVRLSIISAMPGTEEALEGEMKVRLWAMMTSRWLSFGRVLVSPAHEEIRMDTPGNRILVVDGLRNDDWSFYCSLNYVNAAIYNLTPSHAPSPTSPSGEAINPPPNNPNNHRQIHHTSFASPFPFPIGFFSVVCLRFLPAYEDSLWPFVISECMKVLKPGGYLELSVMDMDMINMGPRTKRNVDVIKQTLQLRKPGSGTDWFKKSPSDKAMRVLATRGFTDITRCWVGLPAVGNLDGSREESASMQQILKEGASEEVDVSSPEGRNRVVSKVGRWWYSKCFEDYPDDEEEDVQRPRFARSLWEDKTLLRECEKKKTNIRMMMSYARKPIDWKDY